MADIQPCHCPIHAYTGLGACPECLRESLPDELDGWALWQEHRPQDAEDWVEVAKRCASDEDFDIGKARPVFGAAVLLAREIERLEFLLADDFDQDDQE